MKAYQIRWVLRRDFGFMVDIERTVRHPWDEEYLLEQLKGTNSGKLCVEDEDGDLCGYMIYELWPKRIHILRIAVYEDCQRRGIGGALVARLKSKTCPENRYMVTAEVDEFDLDSQSFLRSQGFRAMKPSRADSVYRFKWLVQNEVVK